MNYPSPVNLVVLVVFITIVINNANGVRKISLINCRTTKDFEDVEETNGVNLVTAINPPNLTGTVHQVHILCNEDENDEIPFVSINYMAIIRPIKINKETKNLNIT